MNFDVCQRAKKSTRFHCLHAIRAHFALRRVTRSQEEGTMLGTYTTSNSTLNTAAKIINSNTSTLRLSN